MKTKLVLAALTFLVCLFLYFSSSDDDPFIKFVEVDSVQPKDGHLFDLTNFSYLIHNDACGKAKSNTEIVQIVTSYAGEVTARRALRRAYPTSELEKLGVVRVFLLGALKFGQSEITQAALLNENERFGDLLQGNFIESYKNLTYKHTMGLRWAGEFCQNVKYVVKMDDDIVVNLYEIVKLIKEGLQFDLTGYVFQGMRPIRMKANKWYVTKREYPDALYPPFISGWLYVTTPRIAQNLAETANRMPYFWIDDVFLTGVVAQRLRLTFRNISRRFTTHPEILDCCVQKKVTCEFLVGPSGGDFDLQTRFQNHVKRCSTTSECRRLPEDRGIEKICVTKRKIPTLGRGFPVVNAVRLK